MPYAARTRIYWLAQIAGWALYALLGLSLVGADALRRMPRLPYVYAIAVVIAMLLSHFWGRCIRRQQWLQRSWPQIAWRAIVGAIAFGCAQSLLLALVYRIWIEPKTFVNLRWLPSAVGSWSFSFLCWFAIYFSSQMLHRMRRSELEGLRLELARREAELRALQAQIHPHFLFNSLNSLRALIYSEPERAGAMVDQIASLLRHSLSSNAQPLVALQDELAAAECYLRIEKIRFEERLVYRYNIADEARTALLPPMILQTLVENAVKHGVEPRTFGEILIEARRVDDILLLRVVNTGAIAPASNAPHLGLDNARQRLRLLMGEKAALELRQEASTVAAELHAPWREEAVSENADRR